jgi:hypothetical protein
MKAEYGLLRSKNGFLRVCKVLWHGYLRLSTVWYGYLRLCTVSYGMVRLWNATVRNGSVYVKISMRLLCKNSINLLSILKVKNRNFHVLFTFYGHERKWTIMNDNERPNVLNFRLWMTGVELPFAIVNRGILINNILLSST